MSEYFQPQSPTAAIQEDLDDLLDEPSLQTVLDMMAVMATAAELTQLECLSDAQKRQVWAVTPEAVKLRLKQIKASAPPEKITHSDDTEARNETDELRDELAPELDDLGNGELADWEESIADDLANLPLFQGLDAQGLDEIKPDLQVGDWVVLKAKPHLSSAELKAIWEVMVIQGEQARIEAKGLGTRQFPLVWMVLYPELEF